MSHWVSMRTRVRLTCSSGTARDGLDVLPLDGLFELVALVVDRDARSAQESCPVEGRTMRNRRPARLQRRYLDLEVNRCSAGGTGVQHSTGCA